MSMYYFVFAQETVLEETVEIAPIRVEYDDSKDSDSYVEKIKKSATSTPELDELFYQDTVIDKLERIESKLDFLMEHHE